MARYGLPDNVEFCSMCVMSNQKGYPIGRSKRSERISEKYTGFLRMGFATLVEFI